LKKVLPRVEAVEWLYDGLNGKIIKWTLENGNTHKDPSCLVFLVGRDGKLVSSCPGGQAYSASGMSKWLKAEVAKYERSHPRTRVAFLMSEPESLEQARESGKNVLVYFGRESYLPKDKRGKSQRKACAKFEKGTLNSKKAADAAKGWVLLRFDLAQKAHAELAKKLGVEAAPALLMFLPRAEKPQDLGSRLKGPNLAYLLKKHPPGGG